MAIFMSPPSKPPISGQHQAGNPSTLPSKDWQSVIFITFVCAVQVGITGQLRDFTAKGAFESGSPQSNTTTNISNTVQYFSFRISLRQRNQVTLVLIYLFSLSIQSRAVCSPSNISMYLDVYANFELRIIFFLKKALQMKSGKRSPIGRQEGREKGRKCLFYLPLFVSSHLDACWINIWCLIFINLLIL